MQVKDLTKDMSVGGEFVYISKTAICGLQTTGGAIVSELEARRKGETPKQTPAGPGYG